MTVSSPFESVHERMGARFAEYDGWRLPKDFGDPAAEQAALADGAAACDLTSFGRIAVKGDGSEYLLTALLGGGKPPTDGLWHQALLQGAPVRIACLKGGYLILTPPAQRQAVLEQIATPAAQSPAISVADLTGKTAMLGIYGPRAFEAITKILPFDLSDLEPGSVRAMSFFMISITLLRGAWTGGDGVELICPASAAPLAAGAVAKYQQRENILPAGMDSLLAALAQT